ncbi:MAG: hypothetical protein RL477_432 [Pseudomonadota bacterium]|jgi:cytochrome c oxidase assembly protein subunit 11
MTEPRTAEKRRNAIVAYATTAVVAGMLGLAYASVPLYRLFCQITGYGGTTGVAAAPVQGPAADARVIRVSFDANVSSDLPWKFEPVRPFVDVKVGEQTLVHYRATNLSDRRLTGTASFNVTPFKVGSYFDKVQCFCFTEQTLAPGESVEMPVVFFVDPAVAKDRNTSEVANIVLSYTFYLADKPQAGSRSAAVLNR